MNTQSAKAKGRRLQQYVAKRILKRFKRLSQHDVHSVSSGVNGVDVRLSEEARRVFSYSIECKNQEKINIWDSLKQCEANVEEGTDPLLIFKRNRSKVYVVLELDNFMKIL